MLNRLQAKRLTFSMKPFLGWREGCVSQLRRRACLFTHKIRYRTIAEAGLGDGERGDDTTK